MFPDSCKKNVVTAYCIIVSMYCIKVIVLFFVHFLFVVCELDLKKDPVGIIMDK